MYSAIINYYLADIKQQLESGKPEIECWLFEDSIPANLIDKENLVESLEKILKNEMHL